MKGSTININLSFIMDRNLHAEQVLKLFPNSFYLREYKFLSPRKFSIYVVEGQSRAHKIN